ncbi:MAG: hypothetical protein IKP77_05475 [Acholeplasmatales bacterium]|nr:hypothetical protein [Acholeplasmatales bacterium]
MTNFQVYKRTLSFSFIMFLVDLLAMAIVIGTCTGGYFIMNQSNDRAVIGLGIGLVIGIIIVVLLQIFVGNRIKAAQIAMMTKGVVENKLPDNVFHEGFNEISGRFGSITVFFLITHLIKGVFRQIGRGLDKIGRAVGGDVGEGVTSAINSAIQVLIGYLCDCCLGWILYRKDENPFKAGCEGAVIFFKHGKTLIRNIGRIFGMGFVSLAVIGGAFFGIFYAIYSQFPQMFESLSIEIIEMANRNDWQVQEWITNPTNLTLFIAAISGIVLWSALHSVLIRPFILVGVLRNFMTAGIKDIPTEQDFAELDKYPRFAKMHDKYKSA